MKFDKSTMFSKIKDALEKKDSGGGMFANVMKFEAGHTFRLRLLPNLEEDKEPLFHHYVNMWDSRATGNFISALSLQTFGERDPISGVRWKEWKAWKEANPNAENKDYDANIQQKEQWFINVLVMDDPSDPDNNGTVKILKMGPQLKEIVDLHLDGVKSKKYGVDIFIPTENIDLVIVAEKQGVYTTYKNSFFERDGEEVSDEQLEEAYENLHDVEQVYPVKTEEELQQLLDEHYFVGEEEEEERKPLAKPKKESKPKTKPKAKKEEVVDEDIPDETDDIPFADEIDDETEELLAGLDD